MNNLNYNDSFYTLILDMMRRNEHLNKKIKTLILEIKKNNLLKEEMINDSKMKEEAAAQGYTFPYLYDASQSVAKDYTAACTPER